MSSFACYAICAAGMSIHNEIEPQAQTKQYKFEDVRGCDEAKEELVEVRDSHAAAISPMFLPCVSLFAYFL